LEVWEAKAFISTDFSNPGVKKKVLSLEDLADVIKGIQADIRRIKD
jgi:hypothetical protein